MATIYPINQSLKKCDSAVASWSVFCAIAVNPNGVLCFQQPHLVEIAFDLALKSSGKSTKKLPTGW
jgi:hypothetical protein